MTIIPKICLDQNDLKPFIDELKKKLGDKGEYIITSVVPVTTAPGEWQIEIGAAPVKA
jgi:hypothetical protein